MEFSRSFWRMFVPPTVFPPPELPLTFPSRSSAIRSHTQSTPSEKLLPLLTSSMLSNGQGVLSMVSVLRSPFSFGDFFPISMYH